MAVRLRYIGDGGWIPGVPDVDHVCEDEALAADLVAGGLYERADGPKAGKATIRPPADGTAADDEGKD